MQGQLEKIYGALVLIAEAYHGLERDHDADGTDRLYEVQMYLGFADKDARNAAIRLEAIMGKPQLTSQKSLA